MKLLMVNYEFPPIGGGAGHAHRCLLQQYALRQDLLVDVLTSAAEPGVFTESMGEHITIRRVGIRKQQLHVWTRPEVIAWLSKAWPHYRRMIRSKSYDLVHAFFGFPSGWLCYRSRRQLPYVISLRGSDVPGQNARLKLDYAVLGNLLFKPIWRQARALVACSSGLKQRARQFDQTVDIDVIPNGVDLDLFCPSEQTDHLDTLRLITVGRLSATKRVDLIIEAVGKLKQQGFAVNLTIVGDGALMASLKQQVQQQKFIEIIRFTGRVPSEQMPGLYREHDLLVSASMQEGMSNAWLEAIASGLPIVTTRCEGVDELIQDNGIVLEKNQADAMAAAIAGLIRDTKRRQQLTQAARTQAQRFSWDRVADQYLELYRRSI